MQGTQRAIRASEEEMTLDYPRQVTEGAAGSGQDGTLEAAEVEKMISMMDEKMLEEV
jgi:hypothetical protein